MREPTVLGEFLAAAGVRMARLDPQQSRIVELRFFGGLSIEEMAEVMGMSPATVKRHWTTARLWLHRAMRRESHA